MRNKPERILRVVCIVLGLAIVWPLARLITPRASGLSELGGARPNFTSLTNLAAVKRDAPLPPEINARIEKIKNTQILGMIMRPPPMALMGIAGKDALLRSPSGQVALAREGDTVGELKLLKIGTNRVLVLHEGQTKELVLFEGVGSESLLSKGKQP
jgi:hypothetical protein